MSRPSCRWRCGCMRSVYRCAAAVARGGGAAGRRGPALHPLPHRHAAGGARADRGRDPDFPGRLGPVSWCRWCFRRPHTKPLTVLIPEFVTKNYIDYGLINAAGAIAIIVPGPGRDLPQPLPGAAACSPARSNDASRRLEAPWARPSRRSSSSSRTGAGHRAGSRRCDRRRLTVFIGCGTSYNLALSLAALANAAGRPAIAVPGGEWLDRPAELLAGAAAGCMWWRCRAAARPPRPWRPPRPAAPPGVRHGDHLRDATAPRPQLRPAAFCAETHPAEGIVMTSSASLMLLLGLQLLGYRSIRHRCRRR